MSLLGLFATHRGSYQLSRWLMAAERTSHKVFLFFPEAVHVKIEEKKRGLSRHVHQCKDSSPRLFRGVPSQSPIANHYTAQRRGCRSRSVKAKTLRGATLLHLTWFDFTKSPSAGVCLAHQTSKKPRHSETGAMPEFQRFGFGGSGWRVSDLSSVASPKAMSPSSNG